MDDKQSFVRLAEEIARTVHKGQKDISGVEYISHVEDVVNILIETYASNITDDDVIIAWLHDALEDHPDKVDIYMLERLGFSKYVIDGVYFVSRNYSQSNKTYLQWINLIVESNHIGALMVKMCDNKSNSRPERMAKLSEDKRNGMANRYNSAYEILQAGLDGLFLKKHAKKPNPKTV